MEIAHPEQIDQPIAGGEIDARFPFQRIDATRSFELRGGRLDPGNCIHRSSASTGA
jgi:hypothetical protein